MADIETLAVAQGNAVRTGFELGKKAQNSFVRVSRFPVLKLPLSLVEPEGSDYRVDYGCN
jgi:hypothetical protein